MGSLTKRLIPISLMAQCRKYDPAVRYLCTCCASKSHWSFTEEAARAGCSRNRSVPGPEREKAQRSHEAERRMNWKVVMRRQLRHPRGSLRQGH